MEQNVLKQVAENNGVSEQEVRDEIEKALSLAESLDARGAESLDEIISLLAKRAIEALRD